MPRLFEPPILLFFFGRGGRNNSSLSAIPPALEIARDKERTLAAIAKLTSEPEVRRELAALNERIRRTHFSCHWGPSCTTVPVEIEEFVQAWKGR